MSRRFLLVLALFAPPLAAQNPQNAPTLRTRWADSVSQVMPLSMRAPVRSKPRRSSCRSVVPLSVSRS